MPFRTLDTRRAPVSRLLQVSACILLAVGAAGCEAVDAPPVDPVEESGSPDGPDGGETSNPGGRPSAASDFDIATVIAPIQPAVFNVVDFPMLPIEVAGSEYSVIRIDDSARTVAIRRNATGEDVFTYDTRDDLRYVGRVELAGSRAIVVDAPANDRLDQTGPARLISVDLESGAHEDIAPPEGFNWSFSPALLTQTDEGFASAVRRTDDSGECMASIDAIEATSEIVSCWDGRKIIFASRSEGGLSVFLVRLQDNIGDCRQRVYVELDGSGERLIGGDDTCRPYDGVAWGGWDIWTQSTEADFALPIFSRSTLLGIGPNGEAMDYGEVVTGSLIGCGAYVYWYTKELTDQEVDGSIDHLVRWEPGSGEAEEIFSSGVGQSAGGTDCADNILTSWQVDASGASSALSFPS